MFLMEDTNIQKLHPDWMNPGIYHDVVVSKDKDVTSKRRDKADNTLGVFDIDKMKETFEQCDSLGE